MLCYSSNGLNYRRVENGYTAQTGEVLFSDYATVEQLTAAFPGYAAAITLQNNLSAAQRSLANGIAVTSTSTPNLNGTYSTTDNSQNNVNAVTTYLLLNSNFPGGGTTMPWADINGNIHMFPSAEVFKSFATALANYVAAVSLYVDSSTTVGAIPTNQITIA